MDYRVESFVKGEEISGGDGNATIRPWARSWYLHLPWSYCPPALLIRRVHLFGTLSAWLLYHRGVRCIDLDRVPRIVPVYGRGHATDTGYTPLLHEIVRSLQALLLSPSFLIGFRNLLPFRSRVFFFFKNEISIRKRSDNFFIHRFELKKIIFIFIETLFLSFSFFLFQVGIKW